MKDVNKIQEYIENILVNEDKQYIAKLYENLDKSISENVKSDEDIDINILKFNYIDTNYSNVFKYMIKMFITHNDLFITNLQFLKKYNYMYTYVMSVLMLSNNIELVVNTSINDNNKDNLDAYFYLLASKHIYNNYNLSKLENRLENASDNMKNKFEEYKIFYVRLLNSAEI